MTAGTVRTARSAMDVLARVAADALLWQILPLLAGMASHTRGCPMLACQYKTRFSVIEGQRLFPAEHSMASLAVSTQSPEMRVLLGMAGRTSSCCSAKLIAIAMTARAGGLGMAANQRVVGQIVVEANLLERNQRKITAMMFTVACFTGLRFCRRFSVKSCGSLDIRGNTFVTCKTFSILCLACE